MKRDNVILTKSYAFALAIMGITRMMRARHEYELASQLWRSGTSVGANVEEAQAAQSRGDFRSKMAIAAKEARETHYWLRLTRDGNVLELPVITPLIDSIIEIQKLLTSIVKSAN